MSANKFYITYAEAKEVLNRRLYKIPKKLYPEVLKEMENYKLLKKHWRRSLQMFQFTAQNVDKYLNQFSSLIE